MEGGIFMNEFERRKTLLIGVLQRLQHEAFLIEGCVHDYSYITQAQCRILANIYLYLQEASAEFVEVMEHDSVLEELGE